MSPYKDKSEGEAVESDERGWIFFKPSKNIEAVKVASSLGLQGPSAPIGAQLLASGGTDDAATATTLYHANLVAGSNTSVTAALQQPILNSLNSAAAIANMQASAETNSLDLQAMQSMDWLFKKERIYLLAQFWQQVRTSHLDFHSIYSVKQKKKRLFLVYQVTSGKMYRKVS